MHVNSSRILAKELGFDDYLIVTEDKALKNLNDLAKEVTLSEGLKHSLTIAQVKEVVRIVGELARGNPDVITLILKAGRKKR